MSRMYMRAAVIAVLSISPAFAARDATPSKEQPPPEVVSPERSALATVDAALRSEFKEYVGLSIRKEGSVSLTLSKGANLDAAGNLAREAWMKGAGKGRSKDLPSFEFVTAAATRDELNKAFVEMRDVLSLKEVATLDMNEACGCLQVGVTRDSAFERVAGFAKKQGIAKDWIKIVLTSPTFRFLDLQDKYRPTMGGVQVWSQRPNSFVSLCTMGLPTFSFRTGTAGFLTASHCTEGDQGKLQSTDFFQGSFSTTNKIGTEKLDLDMFTSATNTACPVGRTCRFSDAAFVEFTQQDLGITGRLKRPSTRCTTACFLTVTRATDDLRMVYGISGLFTGTVIDKIGRTTGWTSGAITNTCENTNISDTDSAGNEIDTGLTLLCQTRADLISDHGDSGAPIFVYRDTYEAGEFAGILWGGSSSTTSFSPIDAIDSELGSFVYNQAGMSGTFFSSGLFYTSNVDDQMSVLIQPNAVPADQIEIVLGNGNGISARKEIVLVESASIGTGRWTIAVQGSPTTDRNGLFTSQLPGGRLEFRKSINGVMTEVSRLPLDHLPGGTRVTFRWTAD